MNRNAHSSGTLFVVGLGPGSLDLLTPEAATALDAADTVVGYQGYLELIAATGRQGRSSAAALGEEVERARLALQLAEEGRAVALVSSGDAGVYGMGGVVWELAARQGTAVEIVVVPGITAACSAAARLGAPLAHDWACVSLSDLLTPWDVITRRVEAAAQADFVLVLYNPASRSRTHQLTAVADRLLAFRDPQTPVGLVENAYRDGERVEVVTLLDLALGKARVNMFTIVIVGGTRTFVDRGRMITPRIYAAKTDDAPESRDSGPGRPRSGPLDHGGVVRHHRPGDCSRSRPIPPSMRSRAGRSTLRRTLISPAIAPLQSRGRLTAARRRALQSGRPIISDVEMLRAGIRRDLIEPLGVASLCFLNDPETTALAAREGITRSAAGLRRATGIENPVIAIGNAPTALDETLRMVRQEGWRPSCIIGVPVGFVGVEAAKRSLIEERAIPSITSLGRKGGTAVTAAIVNALLELAGARGDEQP